MDDGHVAPGPLGGYQAPAGARGTPAIEHNQISGQFARDDAQERFAPPVLLPVADRREQLWALVLLATVEALAAGRLDDALWRNLAGERTGLLDDQRC
jgi:hypothetical protein